MPAAASERDCVPLGAGSVAASLAWGEGIGMNVDDARYLDVAAAGLRDTAALRGAAELAQGVMDCGGKAEAATPLSNDCECGLGSKIFRVCESGVALRFPPQSKTLRVG